MQVIVNLYHKLSIIDKGGIMRRIKQNHHKHFSELKAGSVTLEEIDLIARKCHHLHDEEILIFLSGIVKKLKRLFLNNGR